MNSTDDSFHKGLNYDRFLGPDSKVGSNLQTAIKKLQDLETAPSCNKMASSALIYTCATFKSNDETQEPTEKTLDEEKILFAARLAVCELSDSDDQNLVPAECASFIPTETNTRKNGWFGYVFAKGQQKPVPRYPDYEQATRQDRDRCKTALRQSPQTWSSYSNALQSANQWCPAVRGDIERDELLQTYKAMAENAALLDVTLRSQAETLHQQMEATRFLATQLRKVAQDALESHEAFRQMSKETLDTMQAAMRVGEVRLQAHINRAVTALEDFEVRGTNMFEKMLSASKEKALQHSKEVALVQSKAAEDARAYMEFELEILTQYIQKVLYNANTTGQEASVFLREILDYAQQVRSELFIISEDATKANELLSNMTSNAQQLQTQQEELSSAIDITKNSLAALDSQVLAISAHISSIVSVFTGIFDGILAVAWRYRYLLGVGFVVLLMCLGGWPILCLAISSLIKLFRNTVVSLKELSQSVLSAAGRSLSGALVAMNQYLDWKVALLMILSVTGVALYSLAVETPTAYWQRWENGDLSLFEPANITAAVVLLLILLGAISSLVMARRESELLQSDVPELFDTKKSAV